MLVILSYLAEKKPTGQTGVVSYPAALQPVKSETMDEAGGTVGFKGV